MLEQRIVEEKPSRAPIIDIDILQDYEEWQIKLPEYNELIEKVTNTTLLELDLGTYVTNVELSVTLANNKYITEINHKFRNKNRPTNVLSFPSEDINPEDFYSILTYNGYIMIGDIVFALEIIQDEAEEQDKLFKDHFIHLLVHGILHLLGYDHEEDEERTRMEELEIRILSKYNIKNPYE
ncbi:MAG: rRNA maturation RNase YbeY [Alphaproteobacteria bacterium]